MNSSRQLRVQQLRFANRASSCDSNALFNLLTDDLMFDKLEQHLPEHRERVFTPTETLSLFLAQALHSDSSCQHIVNGAVVNRIRAGMKPLSTHTGAYCRARKRLPLDLPRELARHAGNQMMLRLPEDWRWKGRAVKMVDGTTFSMPDTDANQARFPQSLSQKPGLGFPICRLVGLMCLGSGAIIDVAYGAYQGKKTGEHALFRELLGNLNTGDVLLGDAYYATYWLLYELQRRGVDGVFEQHGGRKNATDFRQGTSLGSRDHLVQWKRPNKPQWMSQNEYQQLPAHLTVRELSTGGKGAKVLVTTLLDSEAYRKSELKQLYRDRWHIELNFRHIKTTMGKDVLRCQSPEMIDKEIWVAILAYNLVRLLMAQSASLRGLRAHQISFKHTIQLWLLWHYEGNLLIDEWLFLCIAQQTVGNRPNRAEPRAVKRRPKRYPKLQLPRGVAKAKILKSGHPPIVK